MIRFGDRFLIDFWSIWEAKLTPNWLKKRLKRGSETMSKNHQKFRDAVRRSATQRGWVPGPLKYNKHQDPKGHLVIIGNIHLRTLHIVPQGLGGGYIYVGGISGTYMTCDVFYHFWNVGAISWNFVDFTRSGC